MEPARSPEDSAQGKSEEAYEDIIREASQRLRAVPREAASAPGPDDRPRAPGAPPRQGQPSRSADTASELAGVKYEVDRRRHYVGPTSRPGFELTPLRITTLALGALGLLLWARLIMVGNDAPAPPVDAAYAEASMRWALVLTSKRVDDFRRVNRRTPDALSEIGHLPTPLIGYERVSADRYRLTGPTPNGPLVLDSMGSRDGFLGNSLQILREQPTVTP